MSLGSPLRLHFARQLKFVLRFGLSERGVVSVEWVALAAAMAVGAVIIGVIVLDSLVAPAESIGEQLTISEPAP